jgi:hypothetical protein
MASHEWLREHRHLQYLRAAAASHPRRTVTTSEFRRRRRYEVHRWRKLQALSEDSRGRD